VISTFSTQFVQNTTANIQTMLKIQPHNPSGVDNEASDKYQKNNFVIMLHFLPCIITYKSMLLL